MQQFKELLENIPDYQEFLTVDQMDANSKALAQKYPDLVELLDLGKTREGHPIYCLKIGKGSRSVLMYGCPHPNEPMGAMMLEYLSEAMIKDANFLSSFDYTWYLIKSIDIDGTKKNEKWFKPPFSITSYARNFFRPAGYEQVEWTFPIKYKNYTFDRPIPETEALMKIIDETKPEFIYSLHNAGFGGTYWYVSKQFPKIWDRFYKVSENQSVPLHLGEPEVNYIPEFAPAIYKMFGTKEIYDYYETYADVAPEQLLDTGTSAHGYAEAQGIDATVLVTELPYFYEPSIEDNSLLDITRATSFLEGLDFSVENARELETFYNQLPKECDNPFLRMTSVSIKHTKSQYDLTKNFVLNNEEYQQLCKVSEDFDNSKVKRFYSLLSWGTLLRGIETELPNYPELETVRAAVEDVFNQRAKACEELLDYKFIPIKKLIRIQLECGLLVLDQLEQKHD